MESAWHLPKLLEIFIYNNKNIRYNIFEKKRKGEMMMTKLDKNQKHIFSFHFFNGVKTKTMHFYKQQVIALFLVVTMIVGFGCYMTNNYLDTKKRLETSIAELKQSEKNQEALQKKAVLLEVENKNYSKHITEIESKAISIEEKISALEKTKDDLYKELEKVSKNNNTKNNTKTINVSSVISPLETTINRVSNPKKPLSISKNTIPSANIMNQKPTFVRKIQTAYQKIDTLNNVLVNLDKSIEIEHLAFMDISETLTETVADLTAPYGIPTKVRKFTTEFDPNGLNGRKHQGLHVCTYLNNPVVATANGTVITSTFHSGYGNYVKIDHGNGYITLYAHNNSLSVNVGDVVEKGDTIALAGSTGNSSGVHVHYEIMYNGLYKNPRDYM